MRSLVNRRRRVMALRVPNEYQEVTWIGPKNVSAVCYVDTGFTPNQDTRVVTKVMRTVDSSNAAYYGTETPRFSLMKDRADYNLADKYHIPVAALNTIVVADHNKNYITVNGTKKGPISAYAEFTCEKTLTLWCLNGYLKTTAQFAGRMYYFKAYDNGVLVRDFVPCYRKKDNVIGFWCRVTKRFYAPTDASNLVIKGDDVL